MSDLISAARRNDIAAAQAILAAHPLSVSHADPDYGATALHWAAKNGNLTLAELLIDAGANVDAVDASGRTPLQWILQRDDKHQRPVMRLLMSRGAAYSLTTAVRRGTAEHVQGALGSDARALHHPTDDGRSILALACADGDAAVVGWLLASGAPPDGEAFDECSPLIYAIRSSRVDVIGALLASGADPERGCRDAHTALDEVVYRMHIYPDARIIGDMLIARGARPTPQWAVATNDLDVLDKSVAAEFDINRHGKHGETALIVAARRVAIELTARLLRIGADPDITDEVGETPLHVASSFAFMQNNRARTELVRTLLDSGANPNLRDHRGHTPLHAALRSMRSLGVNLETVKLLVDAGADPGIADHDGVLPFDIEGHLDVDGASAGERSEIVRRRDEAIARVSEILQGGRL